MAQKGGSETVPAWTELEEIRRDARMSVARFCRVVGLSRSTWYHWRMAHLAGRTIGHWPSPIVGTLLAPVAEAAAEFETLAGGTWQICGIVDYATKYNLVAHANGTQTAADAIRTLEAALQEALDVLDLPDIEDDLIDVDTGELEPLIIVTDNGPAFKSDKFAKFFEARPYLRHVRTKFRSPQTNGVIERTFQTAKYEYLFGRDAESGFDLHQQLQQWRHIFNHERPHEAIDYWLPYEAYTCDPAKYAENYALRVQKP